MPAILERMVRQLTANGKSKSQAYAIATAQMKKSGNIDSKGNATEKGKRRGAMSPAARARDRAAKDNGGKPSDYKYNRHNNSAVKGRVNKDVNKRS